MPTIHFLNVREGDCSIIQHGTGRVSVIDVCNAKPGQSRESQLEMASAQYATRSVNGNFNQKAHPVNPVAYMQEHAINSIFRFILTHPDMDHLDGITALFAEFFPQVFWDTNNQKEIDDSSWSSSQYNRADWDYYRTLRSTNPQANPQRLTNLSGQYGRYWNEDEHGNRQGGDGITILAPTQLLVNEANRTGDYNDCSYVLLYRTGDKKVILGGDSHDNTWEHILNNWEAEVQDIDLLIAPHHGRDSGRSYDFLDVLNPRLTFFGNARSEHLAYDAWYRRGLAIVTNNQANCMIADLSGSLLNIYVTNETYARAFAREAGSNTWYNQQLLAWYLRSV